MIDKTKSGFAQSASRETLLVCRVPYSPGLQKLISHRAPAAKATGSAMSEFSAKYWRNRAAATAAMADRRWIDETQKIKLLRVAREYDKLADAAAAKGSQEQNETALRLNAHNPP
jgi:hypothetical protein